MAILEGRADAGPDGDENLLPRPKGTVRQVTRFRHPFVKTRRRRLSHKTVGRTPSPAAQRRRRHVASDSPESTRRKTRRWRGPVFPRRSSPARTDLAGESAREQPPEILTLDASASMGRLLTHLMTPMIPESFGFPQRALYRSTETRIRGVWVADIVTTPFCERGPNGRTR